MCVCVCVSHAKADVKYTAIQVVVLMMRFSLHFLDKIEHHLLMLEMVIATVLKLKMVIYLPQ